MALSPSYTLGLIFILLVSLIWAAASVLVQFVYSDKFSFDSPFLLTYTGVSLFTCFLPLQWLSQRWKAVHASSSRPVVEMAAGDDDVRYESIQTSPISAHENGHEQQQEDEEREAAGVLSLSAATTATTSRNNNQHCWTTRDHMVAAAKIAPMWFISNYAYNASLKFTSITSSTVLASTGSLFTFLFALIAREEHFCLYKFLGIVLGMTGSIVTGLHDIPSTSTSASTEQQHHDDGAGNDDNGRLWGDFLGLLSAVGYGGYAIMVRSLCPKDESLMSMQLFLGFVGLWNMICLGPIAIYQGFFRPTGLTWFIFGCLVGKGLFDNVLSDYLWARAVVLTSATVATVGLGLTIPLAFASDIVLGRPNVMDAGSIVGALSVLLGFVLVNLGQQQEEEEQHSVNTTFDHTSSRIQPLQQDHEDILEQYHEVDVTRDMPNGNRAAERLHMSMEYRDEPFQDE